MPEPAIAAVILAAGKSTRMKSDTPKVLHEVRGQPMIEYVLDAARQAGATRLIVVVGHQADRVQAALSQHPDVEFALQAEQKGTGHAVMMCRDHLANHDGPVLVLTGDTPLLRSASLQALLNVQQREQAACVVGTARTEQNEGLGRIVRDAEGHFVRIVEQKDAGPEELKILEINTGCFAYDCRSLFEALDQVRPNNRQQELYLTDCAEILRRAGRRVVAACEFDITEAMGVNTPQQLEEVEKAMHSLTGG
jgi:bifunctional UDP-N-acetylglucosamine pyrophosphorylase / glucosamine-1-phosphate N-acetyltransferase